LHFLLLGGLFFCGYQYLNPDYHSQDQHIVVVDREALLTYLQNHARMFDQESVEQELDSMSPQQLDQLRRDFVREEVLYREAKALQLDQNNYATRLRMIQQIEMITRGFIESQTSSLTEQDIQSYYDKHLPDYYVQPNITFTHVFFNSERRGAVRARRLAEDMLVTLNRDKVSFDSAPGFGDRFLYHLNYVNKTSEEIASHFGSAMQRGVFALEPSDTRWYGPFASPYGYHLVMVTRRAAGYQPDLEQIHQRVEQDALQQSREERYDAVIARIIATYRVIGGAQ